MGNRQRGRQTEEWELKAISSLVHVPQAEINDIYKHFQCVSKDYLLSTHEFRRLYKTLIYDPSYEHKCYLASLKQNRKLKVKADRIFRIFDQDHTGRLTFDEFIIIYVMLQNSVSPQVRLNFLLDHYSQNNGYLTPHMGARVIQDMSQLYGINTDCQQVSRKIEANNGFIPKQAFIEYFTNHPAYSSALYKYV